MRKKERRRHGGRASAILWVAAIIAFGAAAAIAFVDPPGAGTESASSATSPSLSPEPVTTDAVVPPPDQVHGASNTQSDMEPEALAGSSSDVPVPSSRPELGRWIDVDVTNFVVRLMDGADVVQTIGPVAVGAAIDTGEYNSTQTGLFHVYEKIAPRSYDAPYHTYIQWWVGFDPEKANGFHSFLLDERGNVVDASTGGVSNGCIRTGEPEELFAFAGIGMPVYVHL